MDSFKHDKATLALEERLLSKGRELQRFVTLRRRDGTVYSDADLLSSYDNGKYVYLTRYEIKTGYRGRRCARAQAKEWFSKLNGISFIRPNFVYYNPKLKVYQRWKPENFTW